MAAFRPFLLPFWGILRQVPAEKIPNLFARSAFQATLQVGLTIPAEILRQKILSLSCPNCSIFRFFGEGF
jgi:hypothetical protein